MSKMTLDEFQSRLKGPAVFDEAQGDALGEYLQILKPVPEPRLAALRGRVLAEAARLQPARPHRNQLFFRMAPRVSPTWTLAIFLLVGAIAIASLVSSPNGATNLFFGFSSTPTVAMTGAPLNPASATVSLAPTPLNAPARLQIEVTITPAPAPTPAPTLPLMRTAQSQPTD